jgi:tripartite-type tricarboxylate transporter receptor subunit TctC
MMGRRFSGILLLILVYMLLGCTRTSAPPTGSPGQAQLSNEQMVADFYRGKTIRIIVGFAPGGGYDTYSRLIAKYLGNYIPGNPSVIVENMPGAGSLVAANQTYNSLPKDGTVIANIHAALILEQLFRTDGIEFDAAKFRWLAVPVRENNLMIVHNRTGITKLEDIIGPSGKQVVLGGIPGTSVEQGALLMKELLGANVRVVSGYEGTAPVRLAIENGEVDGFVNTWQSIKLTNLNDINNGNWTVLVDLEDQPTKDLPVKAPTLREIGQNEDQRQLVRLGVLYPNLIAKAYLAAPEVPEARAAALETAFKETFEDKAFLDEAEKARLEINPIYSAEIKQVVSQLLNTPEEMRVRLQRVLKP